MGIDRLTRRRSADEQRDIQVRKAAISRLQRLTGTTNVDYGELPNHRDEPFDETPAAGASNRSSAQEAGA